VFAVRRVQRRTAKTSLGYFFEHSTRQPVGKGKRKWSLSCALGKNARQITIIVVRLAETHGKERSIFLSHLLYHVPTDHT
jgi:hypothetical protein